MSFSMEELTDLQRKVLKLLMNIPKGRVTTYREIAKALGNINLSRAVGNVVRHNPHPVKIPCHRVVRSSGEVGGYGGEVSGKNVSRKVGLLRGEGVLVDDKGRIDLKKYLVRGGDLAKGIKKL